jgi:hypothetical protein
LGSTTGCGLYGVRKGIWNFFGQRGKNWSQESVCQKKVLVGQNVGWQNVLVGNILLEIFLGQKRILVEKYCRPEFLCVSEHVSLVTKKNGRNMF